MPCDGSEVVGKYEKSENYSIDYCIKVGLKLSDFSFSASRQVKLGIYELCKLFSQVTHADLLVRKKA